MIAYAGVDQNVVVRGLQHVALDTEYDLACGRIQKIWF
jgi:hypothetical protein